MPPPNSQDTVAPSRSRDRQKSKRTGRNVLLGFAAAVLIAGLVAGGYVLNLAQTFNSAAGDIETAFPDESTRPQKTGSATGSVNILVMGSDSRATGAVDNDAVAPTDQRADTLMLVHIPENRKNVFAISLMRDLWVNIPGHGESKINAALALGGVPLMVQTVESIFQQRIDHVASVDFEGFKDLTDALGGVEVDVKIPFAPASGPMKGHFYPAGINHLTGDEALAFVRERKSFSDGDYQRVRNQQTFLKAVIGKTIAKETLLNPLKVNDMVSAVSPFVSVDSDFDASVIANLALGLRDLRPKDNIMFTLPTNGTGTSSDGQSIVLADTEAISAIATAMAADDLASYVEGHNLKSGN